MVGVGVGGRRSTALSPHQCGLGLSPSVDARGGGGVCVLVGLFLAELGFLPVVWFSPQSLQKQYF